MNGIEHVYEIRKMGICPSCGGVLIHSAMITGTASDPPERPPKMKTPDFMRVMPPPSSPEEAMSAIGQLIIQQIEKGVEREDAEDPHRIWNFELAYDEWVTLGKPGLLDRLTRTTEVTM